MDCFVALLLAMTKGGFPPILFHNATLVGRGLSSGTSPERIAPESVTPLLSGFVHRNISRGLRKPALDQVRRPSTSGGLAVSSLKFSMPPSRIRIGEESSDESERCSDG
jgi:hypothetical protein